MAKRRTSSKSLKVDMAAVYKAIATGRNTRLTGAQHVAISCSGDAQASAAGRQFDVDGHTIRRSLSSSAHAVLLAQELMLIGTIAQLRERPPDYAAANPVWDETGHQLLVRVRGQPVRSTWQVMIISVCFAWGWNGGESDHCEVVVPPIPVPNTQGPTLWKALTGHPFMQPIVTFRKELFRLAKQSAAVNSADMASSNRKLEAHELETEPDSLIDSFPCLSHQNFIGYLAMLMSVFTAALLNNLYAATMFIRMGNHLLRCAIAIPVYVKDHIQLRQGFPSAHDKLLKEELINLLSRDTQPKPNSKQNRKQKTNKKNGKSKPARALHMKREFNRNLIDFFDTVSGGYVEGNGALVVYIGHSLSTAALLTSYTLKVSKLIFTLMFKAMPPTPSAAKWTKNSLTTDYMVLGFVCDILPGVVATAMQSLSFDINESSGLDEMDTTFEFRHRYVKKVSLASISIRGGLGRVAEMYVGMNIYLN